MPDCRVGISGWTYPGWRGVFYPKALLQRRELEYASRCFNSVEINASFYALQTADSYRAWYRQTPPGFLFAVKGSRFITHMKKLRDIEEPLANFFASGVLALGEKLGPILWQFGSNLGFDPGRFDAFFRLLPRDTASAAALARLHTAGRLKSAWTTTDHCRPIRYAVEIRHDSFIQPRFIDLLRRHNIALCIADTAGLYPYAEDITADFVYIRLHGAEQLYWSGYTDAQLDWWAARARLWSAGAEPADAKRIAPAHAKAQPRDIYIYFDNDAQVRAPFDAANLARRLGIHPPQMPGMPLP